ISCAALSLLAILSHNLLIVAYGIYFLAAAIGAAIGAVPKSVVMRSLTMAIVAAVTYFAYLRPIMGNWSSGGTGGTEPIVSYMAALGMPTLALAILGSALAFYRSRSEPIGLWWTIAWIASLTFVVVSPRILENWNPRYAILFMAPAWI